MAREFHIDPHVNKDQASQLYLNKFLEAALPLFDTAGSLGIFQTSRLHAFLLEKGTQLYKRPATSMVFADRATWTPAGPFDNDRHVIATKLDDDSAIGQVAIVGKMGDGVGNNLEARIQLNKNTFIPNYIIEFQSADVTLRWIYLDAQKTAVMFCKIGTGEQRGIGTISRDSNLHLNLDIWPQSIPQSWGYNLLYMNPQSVETAMRLITIPIPGARIDIPKYTNAVFLAMKGAA